MKEIDYRAGERVEIDCTHLVGATVGACAACIAKAIAAAEERGRRRGVEERDELRAIVREVRPLVNETFLAADAMAERAWERFLKRIDAALAPRDSAPVCDAVLSSDPFREWRCGKPKGHEGPHSGDRK